MAKLGTKQRPAVVRVQTEERAAELLDLCNKHEIQVISRREQEILLLSRSRIKLLIVSSRPLEIASVRCG